MMTHVIAPAFGTALSPFGSSPQAVSPLRASIAGAALDSDWPCPRCGLIGCVHDEGLPEYRGAFDTEGRH